jgi:uncharacterized membrane protein YkvA (DUF1232 family)
MSSNPNPSQRLNIFVSVLNRIRLVVRLLRDPRVPLYLKAIPFLSLIYIVMPLDFIPDLLPVLGQVDDLGAVLLAVEAFIMMSPQDVVQEHRAEIEASGERSTRSDTVVDGEWRTVNRDR